MAKNNPTPCIAVLGTGSDVGKSVVTAALCRIFSDLGLKVAPFKAQNMSNNSFVTNDGGEIGRAQVVQAECARVSPHVDMNPLLLKPSGSGISQAVVRGKVAGEVSSKDYMRGREKFYPEIKESLERLRDEYELIIIEGAGSCAEMNLREHDIANFRTARECDASVILVADIEKGGVFAQIIGTLDLLEPEERKLVKGIIINRFRGDTSLFDDGVKFIEEKTGLPVLGIVPYYRNIEIDCEDSLPLEQITDPQQVVKEGKVNIAVIRLPRISNFTDFAPLSREVSVNLSYLSRPKIPDGIDLVILPGTKNVISDFKWLKKTGWAEVLINYAGKSGRLCGICGGYQMLGKTISDPLGIESEKEIISALGLLDIETELRGEKNLGSVSAKWIENGLLLKGYEIHMGETGLGAGLKPVIEISNGKGGTRLDGAISGNIWGTYLHGIFDEPEFMRNFICSLSPDRKIEFQISGSAEDFKQKQYDLLADHFREFLNIKSICGLAGLD